MSKLALPIAELKPALNGLGKIIGKRVTLPVLNHLKIERTKDGWIGLTATDLDHYVTVRLEQPAEGEPVSFLVPYDELLKITKNAQKNDNLLLHSGAEDSVTIEYAIGNQVAERKVKTIPVDEFPSIPQIKGKSIPLPDALRTSIHDAMECASTDQTRLLLNSTYIDVSKKGAHYVVATDGRCLFSSNSFNLPLKESLIIPTNKFIGWKEFNNDGEWQLTVGTPQHKDEAAPFQISSRRWSFISRQIEGSYPNWRQVVPTDFRTTVEFHPDSVNEIIQTIERMPEHDQVNNTLGIEVKGQQLNLLCKASADQPWIAVEIPNTKINGPNVTVYLNRQLVIRALQFGLLRLDLIDALSAVKFSQGGRQMVVMVLRPDGPPRTSVTAQNTPAKDEPEPEKHETSQPAAQLPAAQPERNTMPKSNGNGHEPAEDKPALEKAVEQVEAVKASIKSAVGGINELLDTLKQVQRDHKSSEREVQSVRSTLEKLQSVKL